MTAAAAREHGGGLDAAIARYGGSRADWVDLSTGVNPAPYPLPSIDAGCWNALPDQQATTRLADAARKFWDIPGSLCVLATPGASAAIARLPTLLPGSTVAIATPTYNEHEAAFRNAGWTVAETDEDVRVIVHPNNPDGRFHSPGALRGAFTIIDESFCDVAPDRSFVADLPPNRAVVLKSFGKFWGLAGVRLGFAIGPGALIERLADALGPWPVSGPALEIGASALADVDWAETTRKNLTRAAKRLDRIMAHSGAQLVGGTPLFRLYAVDDAPAWQGRLADHNIWSRCFSYNRHWLRLGLPPEEHWDRLEAAL